MVVIWLPWLASIWGLLLGQLLGELTTMVGRSGTNVMNTIPDSVLVCLVEYNISVLAYFSVPFQGS